MIKKVLAIFIVTSLPLLLLAQNSAIDSARAALMAHSKDDTAKVNRLNTLSWEFNRTDLDSTSHYANKAKDLAKEIDYPSGYGRALNLLGIVAIYNENSALCDSLNKQALLIAEAINDSLLMSQCLNDLAVNYMETGETAKALEYYQNALRYTLRSDLLGQVYTLSNISSLYLDDNKPEQAEKYLISALDVAKKSKDPLVICLAKQRTGDFYYSQEDYDKALTLYNEAMEMSLLIQDKFTMLQCYYSIGNVYLVKKLYEQATEHFEKALRTITPEENPYSYKYLMLNLANVHFENKKIDKSILFAEQALAMGEANEAQDIRFFLDVLDLLANSYAEKGDYEIAYQYQKEHKHFSDSLQHKNNQKLVAELEAKYQLERKEQENLVLQSQEEKSQLALKNHRIGLVALVLGLLLALLLIAFFWRANQEKKSFNDQLQKQVSIQTNNLQKANKELMNSNDELERFNHIASHDLKEPLRNIIGYIDLIERNRTTSKQDNNGEYFQFVKTNAHRLYKLVEDVLEVSRVKHSTAEIKAVDVNKVLDQVERVLSIAVRERNVRITRENLPLIKTFESQLFVILKNLVENGLKYNQSPNPLIEVGYTGTDKGGNHQFFVKDNGMGIAPEFHDKIFDMFFRLHARKDYEGTGLGLAIVKKTLAKLNGSITLKSELGKGSTFEFSLPVES